jgi:hypothetical protein
MANYKRGSAYLVCGGKEIGVEDDPEAFDPKSKGSLKIKGGGSPQEEAMVLQ